MKQKTLPFQIGADPEFTISQDGRDISAYKFFNAFFKDELDRKAMGHTIKGKGCIGWDGEISTAEIRPTQSNNIETILANMETLFKSMTDKVKGFEFNTNSKTKPTGGHVHIELDEMDMSNEYHRKLYSKMAFYLLPLKLGENKTNREVRRKKRYGSVDEYKIKKFKDKETMEIRTLSAEWLTTKKIAKSTLTYIAICYYEIKKQLCLN